MGYIDGYHFTSDDSNGGQMIRESHTRSLPILQSIQSDSATGGCGSCSAGTIQEDERLKRLRSLASELRYAVERSKRQITALDRKSSSTRGLEPRQHRGSPLKLGTIAFASEADEFSFDLHAPLPITSAISHRIIGTKHLWVSVKEAGVLVLDDFSSNLVFRLANREPLLDIVQTTAREADLSIEDVWNAVSELIGQLAVSGFIDGVTSYNDRKIASPERFARFHLTKSCQLQCIHCYSDSSPYIDRTDELPTSRWLQLAEDFAANGGERVLLTGGEALLHSGCIEILRHCKGLGLHTTLFTNGILVPKNIIAIRENVDQVQVSLDGPDEETNDSVRGRGMYRRILRALDTLLDNGVRTRVGMTAMEQNWAAWKSGFLTLAERFADRQLEFKLSFGIMHYGRGEEIKDSLDVSQTQPIAEKFMNAANRKNGPRITRATTGCGYAEQFVVGPEGTVYPCHLLDGPVCHIDDRPLPEIISMLKHVGQSFDVDHVEGCKDCDIRYLCGGTCRVMDGREKGSRLITTCTKEDKNRRYGNLVELYSSSHNATINN
jgi:radical SAM protein with 4Fe4S-binding SPASM domain